MDPRTSVPTVQFEQMTNFKKVQHPPTPQTCPCDFFIFPLVKKQLRGHDFNNVQEVMQRVDELISSIPTWKWKACYRDWKYRALKCIYFDGNYFEGMNEPPPGL